MSQDQEQTRLNKYLALQLGISRREADDYIERGSVTVNDASAHLGDRITSNDTVSVNSKIISGHVAYKYVLLNKPKGYVCSRKRQGDTPTIYELLPDDLKTLKTVGRLDANSSGLILLTNDGDFAYQMTHPKFYKVKVYEVSLDHDLAPLHQQMISDHGVLLEDGPSKFELERLDDNRRDTWRIRMSEGRNRQIRRTFMALGYTVTALHRTHFGSYALHNLSIGESTIVDKR